MDLVHTFKPPGGGERVLPNLNPGNRALDRVVGGTDAVMLAAGGLFGASGVISELEYEAHPDIYAYGTEWRITNADDADHVIWAGRLLEPVPSDGTVSLRGVGWGEKAQNAVADFTWMERGTEEWTPGDTDPFEYAQADLIDVNITGRHIVFHVREGTVFKRKDGEPEDWKSTVVRYREGMDWSRLAIDWKTSQLTDDYVLEVVEANGPNGDLNVVRTIAFDGDTSDVYDSNDADDLSEDKDLIGFRFKRITEGSKVDGFRLVLSDIRANGPFTKLDTRDTSDMMRDVADIVGGDTSGIEDTGRNGLPLSFEDARAADVADAIALFDDWPWGIYDDGDGPAWVYRSPNERVWKAVAYNVIGRLEPEKQFTDIVIPYRTKGGVKRSKRYQVPALAGGIRTDYRVPFSDPLPDLETADLIGPVLAANLAVLQISGEVELETMEDVDVPGVTVEATRLKPVDSIRLSLDGNIKQRIEEVAIRDGAVRVRFPEFNTFIDRMLALRQLLMARGRGPSAATIAALNLGKPKTPTFPANPLTFKRASKKNHKNEINATCKCDPVTEDIRGNATVPRGYRFFLTPVDALGVPIPEILGGETYEKFVKVTGDEEVIRCVFRDIERPFGWEWQFTVEVEDVLAKTSELSDPMPAVPTGPGGEHAPPAVTGATLDPDQHKMTLAVTVPTDDENPDEWDQRIDKLFFILRRPDGSIRMQDYMKSLVRTFKISKPGTGTWTCEVYTVDSEQRRSAMVLASGSKAKPPTPLSAPTIAFDQGGKALVRPYVRFTYSGTYTDDDIDKYHLVVTIGGKTYHRVIDVGPSNWDALQEASFPPVKEGVAITAEYQAIDTKGHKSDFSSQASTNAVDPVTPTGPLLVTTAMDVRKYHVYATVVGDLGETDRFKYEISNDSFATVAQTDEAKTLECAFIVPRGSTGWRARVTGVGPSGNTSTTQTNGDGARNTGPHSDASEDLGIIKAGAMYAGRFVSGTYPASSGSRIEILEPASGENDRVKVFGASALAGNMRADAGDLLLEGISGKVAIEGGLVVRSGFDLQIGSADDNTNRIDFRGTTEGQATPGTGHCYEWYDISGATKELKAKFPNGVVKVMANDA